MFFFSLSVPLKCRFNYVTAFFFCSLFNFSRNQQEDKFHAKRHHREKNARTIDRIFDLICY